MLSKNLNPNVNNETKKAMDLGPPPYAPIPKESAQSAHFPIATLILSILITVLGISTTVLAYQNIQLKQELVTISKANVKPIPTSTPLPTQSQITPTQKQQMCGGIAGIKCPDGYVCEMTAMYPDASGTCTKKEPYTCPKNDYVDCMPGPGVRLECTPEAMNWYKTNCANFKGGAL